jgi:signal transduction histidine kinase/ActR/RegA family two-component response regulator
MAVMGILTVAVSTAIAGTAAGIGALTGIATSSAVGFAILLARRRTLAETARLREAERVASLELAAAVRRLGAELDERERTEAARARAEAQLAQVQKLDALGTLAGGVAHDVNNILAAVSGVAEMGVAESGPGTQARADFAHILAAAEHGARLTSNLLGFARRGKLRHVAFNLDEVAAEVVALLERTSPKRVSFVFENPDGAAPVMGDPGQLSQAVMNLCLNAIDAIEAGGLVRVRVTSGLLAPGVSALLTAGERYVTLEVTDNGRGMDAETLAHAFEPFYSGRQAASERHGMGLAMVFGAMRDHHGEVVLRSTVGAGTTAVLRLPQADAPAAVSPVAAPPIPIAEPLPVLVVDDEPMVRTMIRRFLEAAGMPCSEAGSGAEGIALLRARPGRMSLVILDVAMPEMSGTECFALMRALDPGLPILVVSGYPKDQSIEELLETGHAGFLSKPFGRDLLLTTVAQLRRHDGADAGGGGTEPYAGSVLPAPAGEAEPS